MAKRSKKYTVRDAFGRQLQMRFSDKIDARRWQAKEQRKRQAIKAGLELPVESLERVTVGEYAKRYIRRRADGKVLPQMVGRRRRRVVKGTLERDQQLIRDYVIPRGGKKIISSMSSDNWEDVFEWARANPAWLQREKEWEEKRKAREIERLSSPKVRKAVSADRRRQVVRKPRMMELSPATVNRLRAVVSRMYEDAIAEKVAVSNPIARTLTREDRPQEAKTKFWKTREECMRYLAEARKEGSMFFCWSVWQLSQGPRVNETTGIQHKDVSTELGKIEIYKIVDIKDGFQIRERTKGRKSRVVGMTKAMIDAYLELLQETRFKHPEDFVFARSGGGGRSRPASSYTLYRKHLRVCSRAGVDRLTVHQMRHTFAAQYMMAGGNLRDLQELLGHADIKTTQRYGGLSREHLLAKAKLVELELPKPGEDKVIQLKK
jgi:integrase